MESDGNWNVCAAGETIDGVSLSYHLTGTAGTINVITDYKQKYSIQTVTGTDFTQTMCGNNCDLVKGSGTGIISDDEADISTVATTTYGLRMVMLDPVVGNALGAHAKIIVQVNEHGLSRFTESTDASRLGATGV
jgi:hypothetical protein